MLLHHIIAPAADLLLILLHGGKVLLAVIHSIQIYRLRFAVVGNSNTMTHRAPRFRRGTLDCCINQSPINQNAKALRRQTQTRYGKGAVTLSVGQMHQL